MSTTEIIVLVVVIVLAVALVGALVMSRRAKGQREAAAHADQLRQQASQDVSSTLPEAQVEATRAAADAEEARLMAERADERAREAQTSVAQEEARHEHTLREADRLDPRVDNSADDYRAPTATGAAAGTTEHFHDESTDHDHDHAVAEDDTDRTPPGTPRA